MNWTPERERKIRARCEAATPGPWELDGEVIVTLNEDCQRDEQDIVADDSGIVTGEDADFMAHARADLPDALAEIARLREDLDTAVNFMPPMIQAWGACRGIHMTTPDDVMMCLRHMSAEIARLRAENARLLEAVRALVAHFAPACGSWTVRCGDFTTCDACPVMTHPEVPRE